ncbi:MAG: undecaprenyl-phosphate glucose phosphotransferase [Lachnospiraceae bacterium]|nr:undecaprenyl-phosphate glucose phosphotransferase [Lachnospiraceae bacterium]
MIEDNQRFVNRLLCVLDALMAALSFFAAWFLRFRTKLFGENAEVLSRTTYIRAFAVVLLVLLLLYSACDLYAKRLNRIRTEARNILKANIIAALIFSALLFVVKIVDFSRWMFLTFIVLNTALVGAERLLVRSIMHRRWKMGTGVRSVLLVGYSRSAEEYIDRILANPQWGYRIRGILDDQIAPGTEYKGIRVLGTIGNLLVILPENHLDEIAITLGLQEYDHLEKIVTLCEKSGVHTKFIPDYNGIIPTRPYTEDVLGLPVINIRYVPLSNTFAAGAKRLFDIAGSVLGILISSPVMIATAIAIRLTSKGPVIFRQERVGLHNRKFCMYKFRSMVMQDEEAEKKAWTVDNDPRITKVGHFIRRTSIDELPQLFNILKGDMSLVGPRPERPFFVEKFQEEIPRYMIKHQVRPGMTGWAQVHGFRGDTSIRKRIDYDLYYIENWTMWLDIKIIALTVFGGFLNKNAY